MKRIKICPICGREFKALASNIVYCNDSCREKANHARQSAYYRVHKGMIDDCIGDEVYIKEWQRQLPPTQNDINDARMILSEFGVEIERNLEFATIAELDMWKRHQINTILA